MFLTTDGFEEKSISNLQEASARGGKVFLIADEEACKNFTYLSNVIKIPYFNKNWSLQKNSDGFLESERKILEASYSLIGLFQL